MHSTTERLPRHAKVIIVGTGFAGIGMGIALKQAGIDDFLIFESASGVGGTWRDNTYPGAACDVQSHLYSFSFEPNPRWSRMFAEQQEILAYLEHCTEKYDIYPHIRFETRVEQARYDEASARWSVSTEHGETYESQHLVLGCGGLSRPQFPDIAGLANFEGEVFHTARWNHAYDLRGKRVGLIGTGASAIQVVPAIAPQVEQLTVFQRTPPWLLPKPDRSISGVEKRLFASLPAAQWLQRQRIYWSLEARVVGFALTPKLMKGVELLAKHFIRKSIADETLRQQVTPDYTIGCKRILMSNTYYPALERNNVVLETSGIEHITPQGVRTKDGVEHAFDCLIAATGFQAAEAAAPFPIAGRDGLDLNEEWAEGAEAYKGTTVHGYPNLFMLVGPNTGLGHSSMVFMIESQIQYAMGAIKAMDDDNLVEIDVRSDAQDSYNARLHERLDKSVWASGCASWYQTSSGKNTTLWPGFTFEYRARTRRFDISAYDVTSAEEVAPHALHEAAE